MRRLNPLTSIRFFAAAIVVLIHGAMMPPYNRPPGWENPISLYFVLSGFILSYIYSTHLSLRKGRFLFARLARLWPAHLTAIVLIWLVIPDITWAKFSLGKLIATLGMVHTWVPWPDYWRSFVPAAWTISTEFGFYICFPFLVRHWSRTWIWKLAATFVLLCAALTIMQLGQIHLRRWMGPYWIYWLYVHPLTRLFEFTLGMATFELWRRYSPRIRQGLLVATVWECLALLFLFFIMWHAPAWGNRVAQSGIFANELVSVWIKVSSSCFGWAALIFLLALEQGCLAHLLSYPFAVLLGELSYGIYLIHQAVLFFYMHQRHVFAAIPPWIMFPILGLFIVALAYLIWALIEKPCRHFLVRLWPDPANARVVELPTSMITPEGETIKVAAEQIVLPSKRGVIIASAILLSEAALFLFFKTQSS